MKFICDNGRYAQIKKRRFKKFYNYLAKNYGSMKNFNFMNYGFDANYSIPDEFEFNKYSLFLYKYLVELSDIDTLHHLTVLEIGCGQGGGAYYMAKFFEPKSVIALDYSQDTIISARSKYEDLANLEFLTGDAEKLEFQNNTFDLIINIESSHCYADIQSFMQETRRVIKEQGVFLYADFRAHEDLHTLKSLIKEHFKICQYVDITDNVVGAMTKNNYSERVKEWIEICSRKEDENKLKEWAGIPGTRIYEEFKKHKTVYFAYVLTPLTGGV